VSVAQWDEEDLIPGPIPLWHQIAERMRTAVEKGAFSVGQALPSESALVARFGISRTTARTAYDHLENERLVARSSGKGTIVLPPGVDQPLNLLASFNEDMHARGLTPNYRILSVRKEPATAAVASGLAIERGTRTPVVERLLFADDLPIALSKSWLSPTVTSGHGLPVLTNTDTGSLYLWLETACGVRITRGDEFIEASLADSATATLLGLNVGDPILTTRRFARTVDGTPVEYVTTHYVAQRYRFRLELTRP